jgi:hypothetical protein
MFTKQSILPAESTQPGQADQPAWMTEPRGRVRMSESEAGTIYPVLLAAEKAALVDYLVARETGDPSAQSLRNRARSLERHRRKYLALIVEMGWAVPE